jgi:hypothetical protein
MTIALVQRILGNSEKVDKKCRLLKILPKEPVYEGGSDTKL